MAVYTEVTPAQAQELLEQLSLGQLHSLQGIEGGIENTNYFVSSELAGTRRDWVLTVFERLSAGQLPFYLNLMRHLAQRGLPVPNPVPDALGNILLNVQGKPAALVNRLPGNAPVQPDPKQCAQLGATLARLHLAARDYEGRQPNLRGLAWWNDTVPVVRPYLNAQQETLIRSELAYQNHIGASSAYAALPCGAVHADLFRDNALFDGEQVSGLFDFYFAAIDTWLFDLAVCLNDWCMDPATAKPLPGHFHAMLQAYCAVRPLQTAERQLLGPMLRAAALRFWISRLWDFHLPRDASLLQPHDPGHFERVLRQRSIDPVTLEA